MRRQVISTLLVLVNLSVVASGIESGYKALAIFDYFKARQIFYKQLKKHPAEAAFGLATICFRNDNPFHQLDSAYKYIAISRDQFSFLPVKTKKELTMKFGISDTSICILHDSICRKAYVRLMHRPDAESAEKYLGTYARSPLAKKVLCLRDSFIFHRADRKLTVEGFTHYIETYPQSCYLTDSKNLLEFAIYMETTAGKTDRDYLSYITQFPKGKYQSYAKEELLNYYIRTRNAAGIHSFIQDYGTTYPTNLAWSMLLGIEAPHHTKNELESFLAKYPDYPKRQELEEEFVFWNTPFFLIRKNEKFGYCDSTGKQMIAAEYSDAEDFSEGYAVVQKGDAYGYINKAGRTKIDFQYSEASGFVNNVAIVQQEKKFFIIDHANKMLSTKYDEIAEFAEGMSVVKKNNQYGAINLNGQEVIKPAFDMLSDFSEGMAVFLRNGKYGFLDKQGFVVIAPIYDWVSPFKNGQARAQFNKQFGVVNRKGDFVLQPEFDLVDEGFNGVYLVVKNNQYGFADSSGCLITEARYAYQPALKTKDLTDGKVLRIITSKKQELQNLNGAKYFPDHSFTEVSVPLNNLFVAHEKGKVNVYHLQRSAPLKRSLISAAGDGHFWYLQTKKGLSVYDSTLDKMLFSIEANSAEFFSRRFFIVSNEDGKGLTDMNGNVMLSLQYDDIRSTSVPELIYIELNEKGAYYNISARTFVWKEDGFDSL